MPLGPFGEVLGTTGTMEMLGEHAQALLGKSRVAVPRNPKLVTSDDVEYELTPSRYLFQMSLTTEQKLANTHKMRLPMKIELLNMAETTHQKFSNINLEEPMFQPFPSEVFFQNYKPHEVYEVPLLLRNGDKVPRLVKVTQADSPYFKIVSPLDVGHKVGPGLPTIFKIQFRPEDSRDYTHELVCITEREKFIVPVRAIGARAILDFPDEVNFAPSPVKHPNTKTLLVRNVGTKDAKFSLRADKPFSVTPENGILPVNESMQVTITFKPTSIGDFSQDLLLDLDTGETIHIKLYGAAQDALVRLDKNSVRIKNTYIGMANQRTVSIVNRSDVIVSYKWSNYATQEEEDQHKHSFYSELRREEDGETDRFLEECNADPSIRDKLAILSRTFNNRWKEVESDSMLFSDPVFRMNPPEGEVWPNSTVECEVIFKPDRHDTYQLTAFCDVTGRESRLPLKIRGEGIGPKVQFSFDRLDMGHIFINACHTYEVVLANRGDIDAIFSVLDNRSNFGQRFSFNPREGILMPDGHQAIEIKFQSPILGEFDEVFEFQIDGSPQRMSLNFRGVVIGPTFHFDVPRLRFGTVSYGFPFVQECTLYNTSLVPMTYTLRIPSDGETKSMKAMEPGAKDHIIARPREFTIQPKLGRLPPQSSEKITVELVSNSLKKYDCSMVVDVEGVGEEVLTLPIQAKCVCPAVTVQTPVIEYGRCFLRHPYERAIRLSNDSDLPAKYELLRQHKDGISMISYHSTKPKGMIEPRAVVEVPLIITPLSLDELSVTVHLHIFGSPDISTPVHVTCVGEGPVVHIEPLELDWGRIPVLEDVTRTIKMSNESLIPAKFTATMVRTDSSWRVEPDQGEIPPERELEITVIANLNDCLKFQDKLQIDIENSFCRVIPVNGTGHGTTIVADVPFGPQFELGPHFGCTPLVRHITFTNKGRRHQQLVWSTNGFPAIRKKRDPNLADQNDVKVKSMAPAEPPPRPVFSLTPERMELQPGESVVAVLEGSMDEPRDVRERLMCHAIIGRSGGKELIKKVDLTCQFIAPLLQFSDKHLFFRVDKMPGAELCVQYRDLEIQNVSSLPITAQLKLKYPFQFISHTDDDVVLQQEMCVELSEGEVNVIKVQFDPFYQDDYHIRTVDETLTISYLQHPHVDQISLRGEVYFPNLQFEKTVVDFTCILNDTEVTRYVNITNNSPMDVTYKWSFLVGDQPHAIWNRRKVCIEAAVPEEASQLIEAGATPEITEVAVHVQSPESEKAGDEEEEQGEEDEHEQEEEHETAAAESRQQTSAGTGSKAGLDNKEVEGENADEEVQDLEVVDIAHEDADEGMEKGQAETRGTDVEKSPPASPRLSTRHSKRSTTKPGMNPVLQSLLIDEQEPRPVGVEEVFDILPLYGHLKPGDTEQITFTFYGHADIWSRARAICEVDGGPTYEIELKGEAGLVEYKFDTKDIEYGDQMYNEVASAEITLCNTGKVGFEYCALNVDPAMEVKPKPGVPVVIPYKGYLEPLAERKLTVKYLPGVPENFHKTFLIQVAHFEPDTISAHGRGIFPRISLDLPRASNGDYNTLVEEVKSRHAATVDETKTDDKEFKDASTQGQETGVSEFDVHQEAERLMVQKFAQEQFVLQAETVDMLDITSDQQTHKTKSGKIKKDVKPRPLLSDYVLDFGYVILGTVRTHVVRATNTGHVPVSFALERKSIHQHGFHVELDRVRHLPGAPDHESVDFVVSFDPRGANLQLGPVETTVPINIVNGPSVGLRLRAEVTMPDMEISSDRLDFGDVKCGECKVITVQLHNHKHVRCQWTSLSPEKEKVKIDKTIPMHLRRKMRPEKPRPKTFEVMPPTGCLLPGQRVNVQVKFMPSEEKFYEQRLSLRLCQSSQRVMLLARGQGMEPKLEFSRVMVEFGPVLPHSSGDEQDIVVKNPCPFPLEFYNQEFDRVYLEEEKILRLMKGYDEYNTILLPPRQPGDKLPQELLDYYDEQMKKLEEAERLRREEEEAAEQARLESETPADGDQDEQKDKEQKPDEKEQKTEKEEKPEAKEHEDKTDGVPLLVTTGPTRGSSVLEPQKQGQQTDRSESKLEIKDDDDVRDGASSIGVGELEITPVSAAIARHLGIDLSPDGRAARNRRGVGIIVHGAPMTDQSGTAVKLAKYYGAALLRLDEVITEAISTGNTPAGLKARQMCQEAARHAEELKLLAEDPEAGAKAGLSVEQVTAHTADLATMAGIQSTVQSMVSNRKTSVIQDKGKDKHHGSTITAAGKTTDEKKSSTGDGVNTASQPASSSPPPVSMPIARRLSVSASVAGEDGLMSTILPEDVVVAIIAERLQLSDCHRGIVMDGLETLFCPSMASAAVAVLKALNNRKYLFFVSLKNDYNIMKENERNAEIEKERLAMEAKEKEKQRLEEMSEDEYDALSEQEKAEVDRKRLEVKKERLSREAEEREERQRREREAALEAELRRQEEEKASKRRGKKGAAPAPAADDKKDKKGPGAKTASQDKIQTKGKHDEHKDGKATDRPESLATDKSDSNVDADGKKKKGKEPSNAAKRPVSNEVGKEGTMPCQEETIRDPVKEAELALQLKFKTYDHSLKELTDYLTMWDRTSGQIRRPLSASERSEVPEDHPHSGKKGKKDKHDKAAAREERERAAREAEAALSSASVMDGHDEGDDVTDELFGIPNIMVNCSVPGMDAPASALASELLPSAEEVLDGLGMGDKGPPIPPPAVFSVVPYPVKRRAPPGGDPEGHYVFIASSPDDPNIGSVDGESRLEDDEKSITPERPETHAKSRKEKLRVDSRAERKPRSAGKRSTPVQRRSSLSVQSSAPGTPQSEMDTFRLSQFRWIVPANGEVVLRLRFQSEDLGQFDQTMNFEIMGTRRRYQLFCRGVSAFPTISKEPRLVFAQRKKSRDQEEIVHKAYVLSQGVYEFGPLLAGKSREKYKEDRYPENAEKMTIVNSSPLEADCNFCFLNDSKADTFLLDPPQMTLKPGEQRTLSVWAYPKTQGRFEDAVVCCIRENPEPVVFNVACDGVRPELELDKKQLHFDKVLLHRKDTKVIYLRNSTLLPVAWRVSGLESLGDDFSVSQESGIIEAKSEFGLQAYFRAMKPVTTNKKSIRLEVYDIDNIIGLVHTENIQIFAEAYDVALDMSFPKGAEGGIDFGTIRVLDEAKQTCTLKNKGKYEIGYNFILESPDPSCADVSSLFSVIPQRGTLTASEKATQVQVVFKSQRERTIKDLPFLKCQVIEPNIADSGETIASIPIKVSVKSVFSKYNIFPINDINFGALLLNSRKSRTFTIENTGEFEFKYTIQKSFKVTDTQQTKSSRPAPPRGPEKFTKSREGSSSGRSVTTKSKRVDTVRQDTVGGTVGGGARLGLGMFAVYPSFGMIQAGSSQVITVECVAENAGRCEEELSIDISDRDPTVHKDGIPYRLLAECCVPQINITDVGSIFEEHRVVKSLGSLQGQKVESASVYGEEENRFVFNHVIVGCRATARFKISNPNKVPCDVMFSVKTQSKYTSSTSRLQQAQPGDVFDVEPPRAQIPAHGYIFATVGFTPSSMQYFSAQFEASLEGVSGLQKAKSLTFDVSGEGNLPRVSVLKPAVKNRRGQPLCLFRRNLVGRSETMPLVLNNDGNLPTKVDIDLIDPDDVFTLKPATTTSAFMSEVDFEGKRRPHTASVVINIGEQAQFDVIYKPKSVQKNQAHIKLQTVHNEYEDGIVHLVGEGYEDDVTLDNIHSVNTTVDLDKQEGAMADDDIEAALNHLIHFGDCTVKQARTLSFSMTNHSQTDCLRFQWPEIPDISFSPMKGHVHPGRSKEMTVTLKCQEPRTLDGFAVDCKLNKITFQTPETVTDWDDRLRTVKWIDVTGTEGAPKPPPGHGTKKKVIETEPEPAFTEVAETARTIQLLVSATVDYAQYECSVETVKFRDTLMFQTRCYELSLHNSGSVQIDYSWTVCMEDAANVAARSVTFADGSRPPSEMGSVVSAVSTDDTYMPFSVEPPTGSILPDKSATFTVKFSPLDTSEYEGRLLCRIPNLEGDKQGPVVAVKGRSLLPYCHFELEDSDYISGNRRNPELRGPHGSPPGATLDPNTRVIEFQTIGVGVKNTRFFSIINPTNQDYTFHWVNEDDPDPKRPHCFTCLTTSGNVRSGKKHEIGFQFIPEHLTVQESFWRFVIPERNISIPFLLVGEAREPNVVMDRSHLNFRALLVGHEAMETVNIINNENVPFNFSFDEFSTFSAGHLSHLMVEPMRGVIPPKSTHPIDLFYTPRTTKEDNFNLVCNVHHKVKPLSLNVKAEGYAMSCMVMCEDSHSNMVELSQRGVNEVQFGDLEINELSLRNVMIVNNGKFKFDYVWQLNSPKGQKVVSVSPDTGSISPGDKLKCVLSFCPTQKITLRTCELLLKISNGPTYVLNVTGAGVMPGLHFGFQSYDFGAKFIYRAGMSASSTVLRLTNKDRRDVSVECLYTPTSHLSHDFDACVIPAGDHRDVTFTFYPRERIKYKEKVTFDINGLSKQTIEISGSGTEMRIEVANPRQKVTNLGALRVGQTVKKVIPIVNNSPAPLTFQLTLTPTEPLLQNPGVLSVMPSGEITLAARGGTRKVEVTFSPKHRVPQFTEEVLMECGGIYQPVFALQGCCHGIDIHLDMESIPFGAVTEGAKSVRHIMMINTGDIGARFRWDALKFAPDFSIQPIDGYISPGMEVPFDITFHPKALHQDIRYENLKCYIEGWQPLTLTLTGMCSTRTPLKDQQHFVTHVRQKETKNLMIINRTNQVWDLRPVIDSEHWSGPNTFHVEPQQTKPYELTYKPMVMTQEGKKHTGSIFFPLPDGNGLLYSLQGTSDAPKPNGKLARDIPCKTQYVEMLSVSNWLKRAQRFKVKFEMIKPEKLDAGTTIKGLDYIDIPGNSKRDYRLTFYAHKEGQSHFKVTFINEFSGEYEFYEIAYKAVRPGSLGTLTLSTPARLTTQHTLTLDNPLLQPVTLTATCNVPEVAMPAQLQIPAQSANMFSFEFLPLRVGTFTGKLEFTCPELGLYQYDLQLNATPPCPEKALHFKTCLGSSHVQVAKFINFAKTKTDYACKVDNADFHVDKQVAAAPGSTGGSEVCVDVSYEPCKLGESRGTLTISSAVGGDYVFPLFATCLEPKPQGPYVIKAGTNTTITFRNVFPHVTPYTFQVDNSMFHVAKTSDNVRARKDTRIVVGFEAEAGVTGPIMGKLTVTCAKSAGGATSVQWVYYLKGIP